MKIAARDNRAILHVKVIPNSSRTLFAGMLGDALKIKIAQPPQDGRANRAVQNFIAETLGLSPSHISIVAGHTGSRKTLCIMGLNAIQVREKLAPFLQE